MLRAGVVVALAVGGLFGVAAPAHAAESLTNITLSPSSIGAGEQTEVKFTVKNLDTADAVITISVTSSNPKVTCSGTCRWDNVPFGPEEQKPAYTARFRVAAGTAIGPGESAMLTIRAGGAENQQSLSLEAPAAPQTVKDVTVRVFDVGTGQPIPGAQVVIEDSANHSWNAQASSTGQVRITSTPAKPIVPGQISVAAGQDGYANGVKSVDGRAGQSLVIEVRLQASASPSAAASLPPTPESTELAPTASEEAIDPGLSTSSEEGGGGLSWILIIMGGLLVALGVGAIVLLLLRRRDDSDDGEVIEGPQYVGPRGPVPASRTVYGGGAQPALAGRPADRTMLTRGPANDAPTMMHRQPAGDYDTPAPRPPQPGYGQPAGYAAGQPTYPTSPSPAAYGSPAYPSSPAGYGAAPAGYGPPPPRGPADPYGHANEYGAVPAQDYAERGYGGYGVGEPRQYDDGYGQAGGGYGQAPAGYGQAGYEPRYEGGGAGYGQPASYGAPAGYGQSGYESGDGYGGNGYDPRGGGYENGYDHGGAEPRNGYAGRGHDADAYYEEPAGRRSAQPRGQRRPLDWLDD